MDVQDQNFSRIGFFWSCSSWFVKVPFPSDFTWSFSVHVWVQISFYYKDTSPIGWWLAIMTSFYLNCLFKDSISKHSHFSEVLGARISTYKSGGVTTQPKRPLYGYLQFVPPSTSWGTLACFQVLAIPSKPAISI